MARALPPADRKWLSLLVIVFSLLYVYFFQGGGWNQNSRFDTVRALVETRSFEITPFASNTGDVAHVGERVYSNKAPGQAVLAAPFYAVVYGLERMAGMDVSHPSWQEANAYLVTVAVSGAPAVGVVALLFLWFRRRGAGLREALTLSAGFGLGSMLLPYSGVLMNHTLSALLLFWPWYLVTGEDVEWRRVHAAGWMLGLGIVTEFVAALPAGLIGIHLLARDRGRWQALALASGASLPLLGWMLHNALLFGGPLTTNYAMESEQFRDASLLLGVLDWPRPIRLYWLTLHPYRGLFVTCPILLLGLVGAAVCLRRRGGRPSSEGLVASGIVACYVLFNMSFNGWTGGFAIGPRYLIPCTPFLFLPALPAHRAFPRLSTGLIVLSSIAMFSATAVDVMVPGPNGGEPPDRSPVLTSVARFATGDLARNRQTITSYRRVTDDAAESGGRGAFNLGQLAGLPGLYSVVPILLLVVAFFSVVGNRLPPATEPTRSAT